MSYKKKSMKKAYRQRQTFLPPINNTSSSAVHKAIRNAKARQKQASAPQPQPVQQRIGTLERDADGYYAKFTSKSNPEAPPYTTRYWTRQSGRFSPGDISCNCKGWIYNHKCHHTDDLTALLRRAGINP